MVIFGPPAVGKMTVGRAVTARSGFRLFHNHAVLEPLLEVFDHDTPPIMRLLGQWRRRVIEEAAAADIDLVLTFVWGLELEDDVHEVSDYIGPYVDRAAAVSFVELYADLDTRLERHRTEHRLAEKRSKRDVTWSEGNVRDLGQHVMNTGRRGSAEVPTRASCCWHGTRTSSSTTPGCHPMRPPRRSWLGSTAEGPLRRWSQPRGPQAEPCLEKTDEACVHAATVRQGSLIGTDWQAVVTRVTFMPTTG